ncbi:MAG: PstS family phosphate ABC transporter substrate-binding protein [bacterium]
MKKQFTIAVISLLIAAGSVIAGIVVKGSDTMAMLGQGWAEAYTQSHPGADISVQGGGSGTGIAALIAGSCDICQASRAIKEKEIDKCRERNIYPVATTVAMDGVAFAVNSANPIKSLTMEQLKGIYTGQITNWNQVGGNDMKIVVLSRENSSGTYAYVQEFVLGNARYASTALMMPTTKAIQAEVANNARAIGYGGEAYFKNKASVKVLTIAAKAGATPVYPTDDNVRSKKYPISRPLFFYTNGKPAGQVKNFVNFCLSEEGQTIAEKLGYVALKK